MNEEFLVKVAQRVHEKLAAAEMAGEIQPGLLRRALSATGRAVTAPVRFAYNHPILTAGALGLGALAGGGYASHKAYTGINEGASKNTSDYINKTINEVKDAATSKVNSELMTDPAYARKGVGELADILETRIKERVNPQLSQMAGSFSKVRPIIEDFEKAQTLASSKPLTRALYNIGGVLHQDYEPIAGLLDVKKLRGAVGEAMKRIIL